MPTAATRSPLSSRPRRRSGRSPPDTSISIVRFSDQRHQKRPARLGWLCPAGSICWSLLADRDRSAFSPLAKIMVATSVCTGGRKCPPDTSISIVRFSDQRHQKRPARLGWLCPAGSICWSLLADRDRSAIFAFGENYGSHQCLHWWQEVSTGHFHFNRSILRSAAPEKASPFGLAFSGAADRDRTGTDFTPRDFKSLVSACSTTAAWMTDSYGITFFPPRQVLSKC